MSEYKLVPVEPTAEMMATGGIEMGARDEDARTVWKAMIAAAPAVQGEPQPAEQQPCPESIREGAPYDDPAFKSLCREHEIWGTPAAAQCAVFWAAGKRVAEQKPAPDVAGLVASLYQACGAYDMPERILDVLSAAANGEPFEHMIDGLLPCVPPSDQDVAALVDALTELCDEIDNHDIHSAISKTNILWFKRKARAALAAHRKQGGE